MLITKIAVSASRKVPHPATEFGSLSALVSLEAVVDERDDLGHIVPSLQSRVEEMVDTHLRRVSTQIEARHRKEVAAAEAQKKTAGAANRLAAKHSSEPF